MPQPAASRFNQTIALIESSPLNPTAWEKMAERARAENDPMSVKSLEIIIAGLRQVEAAHEQAARNKIEPQPLSANSLAMFMRLAKAYNSPTLLKEVGIIYLRDLELPEVALHHFERAVLLGAPEKELQPLTAAAAVAVQRQLARQKGSEPELSGMMQGQHVEPVVTTILCQTGKMLLPARFTQTAGLKKPAFETEGERTPPLPATTAECLAEAEAEIGNGSFRRAELLLRRAKEQPGEPVEMWQGWTHLGQACYEKGDFGRVETAFAEALKYGPNEMASHFNAALGYHLNQKFEEAVAAYIRANEIEAHPKVWCNLGSLYFQMDAFVEAEEALRHAVKADPAYARAWDNLASALGAQNKLDEAIEACQQAIVLRPDYLEVNFKMGVIFFSKNRLEQAAAEFQRAAILPDLAAYCAAFLAMIYARLEQPQLAEMSVRKAAQLDPRCDLLWMAWNDLGLAWYSNKNGARALVAYGEATRLKPEEPGTWFNLGVTHHQAGDLEAARGAYRRAVELRDSLGGAWHNLGIVCAELGDLDAAATAFARETHLAPKNVRAWYDLGVTCEKLGRTEEARIAFARAEVFSGAEPSSSLVDNPNEDNPAVFETAPLKKEGSSLP